jgi:hypothetical protein
MNDSNACESTTWHLQIEAAIIRERGVLRHRFGTESKQKEVCEEEGEDEEELCFCGRLCNW